MTDKMEFPKTMKEFIDGYSFKDSDEVYTNGSELIPVFRVEQALEHYEQEIRAKAIGEFYDKVLNFEDYIEPLDTSEFGAVLLYSGKDITNMIVKIAEEVRGAE